MMIPKVSGYYWFTTAEYPNEHWIVYLHIREDVETSVYVIEMGDGHTTHISQYPEGTWKGPLCYETSY